MIELLIRDPVMLTLNDGECSQQSACERVDTIVSDGFKFNRAGLTLIGSR